MMLVLAVLALLFQQAPHDATDIVSGTVSTARLGSGTANSSTFLRGDSTWATPDSGSGLPAGLIVLSLAACPSGFAEETSLNGKFVLGTLNANGDVTGTGGSDTITSVLNHTHAVNITDPGHNHTQNSFAPRIVNSGTAGTVGVQGASTASNANASNSATTATNQSNTTGITATTGNPVGGVASIDNRPAFVKVIFCKKS